MNKLTALTNTAPLNASVELARLTKELARMEAMMARLTPEGIAEVVNTTLRPLRAEMALVANEQAQSDRANRFDDFSDVDLNALIEEAQQ